MVNSWQEYRVKRKPHKKIFILLNITYYKSWTALNHRKIKLRDSSLLKRTLFKKILKALVILVTDWEKDAHYSSATFSCLWRETKVTFKDPKARPKNTRSCKTSYFSIIENQKSISMCDNISPSRYHEDGNERTFKIIAGCRNHHR